MITQPPVLPIHSQILPGHNQETYQRLQQALHAVPPHHVWIAVCDDLPLQRQLAAALDETLLLSHSLAPTRLLFAADNPDLVQQIQDWAYQFPHEKPALLQILGIEQLTHCGSDQQYSFLRSLRSLPSLWHSLGCSLLIWLPRPWLKQVKRAVPTLCQTIFEFMGEPTPMSAVTVDQPHQAAFSPIRQWPFLDSREAETPPPPKGDTTSEASDPEAASPMLPASSWHPLSAHLPPEDEAPSPPLLIPPAASETVEAIEAAEMAETAEAAALSLPPLAETVSQGGVDDETTDPVAGSPWSEAQPRDQALWAIAYELRDQVQSGDHSPGTLQAAVQRYETLLRASDETTPHRIEALNDLGSLYWLWAQQATDIETYQQRLIHSGTLYEAALATPGGEASAEILTRIQSNLGSVYSLLAVHQEPVHYLDRAIRAFHRALQYTPVETLPEEYAALQTHLGTAYWSLAQHSNEATHLHRAIAAYQEALQQSHPQATPQAHAQLQNNLGIALWSLSRYERPVFLLDQAISAYRSALAYRTMDTDPAGCAATCNNLGTAYWHLGGHYPAASLEQEQAWQRAIAAYETALATALEAETGTLSFDVWATYHSTGVVYDQLAITVATDASAQQPYLLQALNHYVKALSGWESLDAAATDTALQAIVRNLQLQAEYLGIEVQQQSLSQIPAAWLPEIWRKL